MISRNTLSATTASVAPASLAAFLSPGDLGDLLGVSRMTILRMRRDGGGPPFIRVGRSVRYAKSSVDAWIVAGEQTRREKPKPAKRKALVERRTQP